MLALLPAKSQTKIKLGSLFNNEACWIWTGEINRNGYGRVWHQGKRLMTHRVVYTLLVGEIPDGHVLDHLCRNRPCCNPAHMDPVTIQENTLRGNAVLFQAKEVNDGECLALEKQQEIEERGLCSREQQPDSVWSCTPLRKEPGWLLHQTDTSR